MCWHMPAPEKSADTWEGADTCQHVKVPTRADIPDTNHMDFFICKLGYAGMCQHLKRCRHLGRCRHMPTRLGADIPDTNHMDFFICKLGCAGMCQHLKRYRHLRRCRHVPTRLGADMCRHVLTRADIRHTNHMDFFICKLRCAGLCQHLKKSADTWEGADTCRCRHVPTSQILIIWTF